MIISKENINSYLGILFEVEDKIDIIKHIFYRLIGKRYVFEKDIYLRNKYGLFNCGKIFENATIARTSYESELIPYMQIPKDQIFIDVGAHIGKWSVFMAQNGCRVISFEPNQDLFNLLCVNMDQSKKHCKLEKMMVGSKNGTQQMFISKDHPATSSKYQKKELKERLPITKLDSFLNWRGYNSRVGLIKIDVEGMELEVLKGSQETLKENAPKIIFEAWNEKRLRNIAKFLSKFQYHIVKIDEFNYCAYPDPSQVALATETFKYKNTYNIP